MVRFAAGVSHSQSLQSGTAASQPVTHSLSQSVSHWCKGFDNAETEYNIIPEAWEGSLKRVQRPIGHAAKKKKKKKKICFEWLD